MITSYTSVLRRRAGLLLLVTAVVAPLLLAVLTLGSRSYTSTAVVQTGSGLAAGVTGLDTPYEAPETRLATEIEFFGSAEVGRRAQAALAAAGWEATVEELREHVAVTPRGSSSLLDVTGTADSPQRAQQVTSAFTDAYLTHRREVERDALTPIVGDLQSQIEAAEQELAAATAEGPGTPAGARAIAAAQSWYDSLTARLENARLRLAVDTSGVALLSSAGPGEATGGLATPFAVPVALLGGLLAGAAAALLVDVVRDPVRTREEARSLLAAPVLGELTGGPRGPVTASSLRDGQGFTTGARGLRLHLERLLGTATPGTVVVVADPSDAGDALLTGAALAGEWRRAGLKVALVADPAADPAAGAAGPVRLGAGGDGSGGTRPTGGAWLLPASGAAGGPPGLLDHVAPSAALRALHDEHDVVVLVDATPDGAGAIAVGAGADATVVVCSPGRTPAGGVRRLGRRLRELGTTVDGVVLTRRRRTGRRRPAAPVQSGARETRPSPLVPR
ncbi:hypothetical protein MO973_17745 [Paenibacillus sp. TRM 82003]|uniref:hypothetical protein n=1 Tax=Kineococcus sp. TRM81007 TaxID=2925831 RepID=UPI001F561FA3|nr:hypothetical protein [Kineococcus sp. TRM81007]MCI2238414.1 hypothetical protein [Kineococcus sp. TRM81007]MCI3922073.1 hypothetical protein [Paenibacillus sp. TRM 82003]